MNNIQDMHNESTTSRFHLNRIDYTVYFDSATSYTSYVTQGSWQNAHIHLCN